MTQYEINDLVFEVAHRYVDADKTVTVYDMLDDRDIIGDNKYKLITATLTSQERFEVKKMIEDKGCFNCTNGSCRVSSNEKIGFDKLGNKQGNSCIGWENPAVIGRQLVYLLKK